VYKKSRRYISVDKVHTMKKIDTIPKRYISQYEELKFDNLKIANA